MQTGYVMINTLPLHPQTTLQENMLIQDTLTFYARHGPFTDPGPFASYYENLPHDIDALCSMINGLIVHDIWKNIGQLQLPDERKGEINIRSMQSRLKALLACDARPLNEARPFALRQLGCCRDEALVLCSFLRHLGIPARVRKGLDRKSVV